MDNLKFAAVVVGIVGGITLFGPKKKRRSVKKRVTGKNRIRFVSTAGDALNVAKSVKGCMVLASLRPGNAIKTAWKKGAQLLAMEYPSVTFIATDDPVISETWDNQDPTGQAALNWHLLAAEGVSNHLVTIDGEDLDDLVLQMENALLHCPGVS